jgi:hypothetical protein
VLQVLCRLWNFVAEFDRPHRQKGGGVVRSHLPYEESPVIPAKAGIQPVEWDKPEELRVDSRLRGNDDGVGRRCLTNDATTGKRICLTNVGKKYMLVG